MKCPECGSETRHSGTSTTLVGFGGPFTDASGSHEHDDNCLKRYYRCDNGHDWIESKRRTCNDRHGQPACEWVGKPSGQCHASPKVDAWTDAERYVVPKLTKYFL